ncbi:MAG: sugar phosphate nucleotidyltransferase, partial [Planctomycetota bacterium]
MIDYWPAILAGGVGTRFWPESRRDRPKQFLAILGERSLLRQTVDRVALECPPERILVVTNARQAAGARERLPFLPAANVVAEPVGRNTAPCAGLAALLAQARSGGDPVIGLFPSDAWVSPPEAFSRAVRAAVELARAPGAIVVLGIEPAFPATGYGYVKPGAAVASSSGDAFEVVRFTEKPGAEAAAAFLKEGHLWNAGIFFTRAPPPCWGSLSAGRRGSTAASRPSGRRSARRRKPKPSPGPTPTCPPRASTPRSWKRRAAFGWCARP